MDDARDAARDSTIAARPGRPASDEATRTSATASADLSAPADPSRTPGAAAIPVRDPARYELLGEHGRGGLGRVSRALDRELGRDVAIKELLNREVVGEIRFLREALITARLEHPGIVPVHEAGRWPDGTPFYAMKLVSGRPLRDLIAERTSVEQRISLLHHVIAVADAIAYAHGKNIIHRDLKPANIIVGDFGETVVIDWGLAKDLTADDDAGASSAGSGAGSGGSGSGSGEHVTRTGSVLGTPAYMAPEQARGEPVDQRADVFAIGAMLWELCALHRDPPTEPAARHRALRGAGIDRDLITIIDKALAVEPAGRYADAGALAADLKAFKSGARISARSYSLLALFGHWTRRHRSLALAGAAALVLAAAGTALYVRDIAVERDRADASDQRAERALAELTLRHAQLLLHSDPSAAVDALDGYRGADRDRAAQIRAEAEGRGVAVLRATPHTDNVTWLHSMANGDVLSLGYDGTITRTARGGASVALVHNVIAGNSSYSAARSLLAYTCEPADVCLFDVARAQPIAEADALRGVHPSSLAISPSGDALVTVTQDGTVRMFDIRDQAHPVVRATQPIAGAVDVLTVGDDDAVAATDAGVELVHAGGAARERFAFPDLVEWDTSADEHRIVVGARAGRAVVLETGPLHAVAQHDVCAGGLLWVKFVPHRHAVAYACRDGAIGTWDTERDELTTRLRLAGRGSRLAVSADGDYLVAAGGDDAVTVFDLVTELASQYRGQGLRIMHLEPPSAGQPFALSADVRGGIRAWPLPPRFARVAAVARTALQTTIFDASGTAIATPQLPSLVLASASGPRTAEPHEFRDIFLRGADRGEHFACFGLNDHVELWAAPAMTRLRELTTGQGLVNDVGFAGDSDELITAGHDGSLLRWSATGPATLLAKLDASIELLASATATGAIVFATADGALWHTDAGGRAASVRASGGRVVTLRALADGSTVYAGYADGSLLAIDTRSWHQAIVATTGSTVRDIVSSRGGELIAFGTNDGAVRVGIRPAGSPGTAAPIWQTLQVHARHIALSPDGIAIATSTDGVVWLYELATHRWLSLPISGVDLGGVAISPDGRSVSVIDSDGHLTWLDLAAARQLLAARDYSAALGDSSGKSMQSR